MNVKGFRKHVVGVVAKHKTSGQELKGRKDKNLIRCNFFHLFPWLREYETSLRPELCHEGEGVRKRPEN